MALPFIIGMGIDELSVAPNKVEEITAKIRMLNHKECQLLVKKILDGSHTLPELKQFLYTFLKKRKLETEFLTEKQLSAFIG